MSSKTVEMHASSEGSAGGDFPPSLRVGDRRIASSSMVEVGPLSGESLGS